MSPQPTVDVAVDARALLGECPLWCDRTQRLYWVDIDGQVIHRYDPVSETSESRGLGGRPGSIALTQLNGELLVAIEHQLIRFNFDQATAEPWLELETPGTGNRLNDGKCDPAGRFVVGSMFADTSAGRTNGTLYQISAEGAVATIRSDVGVANGLGFDPDRQRMYFADTPTQTVTVYDYDADGGVASNPVDWFDYRDLDGKPDGACVDADGCYWSASVYGWAITRITPDGAVDRRIEVPIEKPSMPAFGGTNLDTLFVTTIGAGGTVPSAPGRNGVHPGALLAIDAGVSGRSEPRFAG